MINVFLGVALYVVGIAIAAHADGDVRTGREGKRTPTQCRIMALACVFWPVSVVVLAVVCTGALAWFTLSALMKPIGSLIHLFQGRDYEEQASVRD